MGYPYDSEEDLLEDTDFQKKMMKLSLVDLKQRHIIKNKMGPAGNKKKEEEKKQSESNGPGQGADEEDVMEITVMK